MGASKLRKLGLAALLLSLLTVALILFLVYGTWSDFKAAALQSDRTRGVLENSTALLASMRDAETGQRGYLLTGKEYYLEPYYIGSASASVHLQALVRSEPENAGQTEKIERLKELVAAKLTELQQTIDTRKEKGVSQALEIVQSDSGKLAMDRIRQLSGDLQTEEYALWGASRARLRDAERRTLLTTAAGSVLLFLLLTSAILSTDRHSRQRDRLIVELARSKTEIGEVRDLLQTTLSSIGDAVITTDNEGCITFSNHVAQALTGWTYEMALKVHLDKVFRIVNQETRATVESPVAKVLRLGTIVGLANHTILLRKDGTEIHIDDSGAPIRDSDGDGRCAGLPRY